MASVDHIDDRLGPEELAAMTVSRFVIPRMDCAAEEQLVELTFEAGARDASSCESRPRDPQ